MTGSLTCGPKPYNQQQTLIVWLFFAPFFVLIPYVYVLYCVIVIYFQKLLPARGKRRILSIYFFRIVAIFLIMWGPVAFLIYFFNEFVIDDDKQHASIFAVAVWAHLQAVFSAAVTLTKPDILQAVISFLCCRRQKGIGESPLTIETHTKPNCDDLGSSSWNLLKRFGFFLNGCAVRDSDEQRHASKSRVSESAAQYDDILKQSEVDFQFEDEREPNLHHNYRIALYYLYARIPDRIAHLNFQQSLCDRLGLKGRIRIATEGLNGVLSGNLVSLEEYEQVLVQELATLIPGLEKKDLDIKYCQLRTDLPVDSQLFPSLVIKETKTVIGLVDMPSNQKTKKKRSLDSKSKQDSSDAAFVRSIYEQTMQLLAQEQICDAEDSAATSPPVPHLNPAEWETQITHLSQQTNNSVVLLDCRNVYESNVGHFQARHAKTMLTNTRKFSELPSVMMEQSDELSQSTHIFAYCTGGVRCETGTLFLKELLQKKHPDRPVPKIYQLKGGIQRYLEYVNDESCPSTEATHKKESLYHGKNFVFDPRRVDPLQGGASVVGRCLVCEKPHDDYDNGQSPSLDQATRCWNCRVLILVCNDCRPGVSCWGDQKAEKTLPPVYCSGVEKPCWHHPPVQIKE
jgi:predicted sulfurtransferase